MRKRSIITVLGLVATLSVASVLVFGPFAKADPDVRWKDDNGRFVAPNKAHPDFAACGAQGRVDLHRGYPGDVDANATHRSGVAAATKVGAGTLRIQLDYIRVGANDANPVVTDRRPSKDDEGRDNGLGPADPLNSDADYPGNVNNIKGYSDALVNVDADTNPGDGITPESFRVRAGFSVRCTDGRLFSFSVLSNTTSNDA